MPIININKKCKNPDLVVEQCPQGVFEVKNNRLVLNKDNLLKCHLCNACVDICEPKGAITLDKNNKDFIFYVESWGQLSCKEIINEALKIIKDTSNEFIKEIKKKPVKKKASKSIVLAQPFRKLSICLAQLAFLLGAFLNLLSST